MQSVVIDAGNHRVKIGRMVGGKLTDLHIFPVNAETEIYHFLNLLEGDKVMVSSVSIPEERLKAEIPSGIQVHILNEGTPLPVRLKYTTRSTLGKDRIAAVAGAAGMWKGTPVLVVDAGTCMTLDLLGPDGTWEGGNISPGLRMRLRAMHEFTGRLPFSGPDQITREVMGTSTLSALANGAAWGMVSEIEGYFDRYRDVYNELKVVLTGGDAPILADLTKTEIFVEPNLVLTGLHEILQHID
jgi:type III pantothenate kinase